MAATISLNAPVLAVSWVLVGFIGLVGATLIWNMWTGKIDLSKLISEPPPTSNASLSRFQFLIFTFVISISLFLVVIGDGTHPSFPNTISPDVLILMGISGGSYVVSKVVQVDRDTNMEKMKRQPPTGSNPPPQGTPPQNG